MGQQKKLSKKFKKILEKEKKLLLLPHFSPKKFRQAERYKKKRNKFIEDIKKVRRRASVKKFRFL
jgi:hypothetical protein